MGSVLAGALVASLVSWTGVAGAASAVGRRPAFPDVPRAASHPLPLRKPAPTAPMLARTPASAWPAAADADVTVTHGASADAGAVPALGPVSGAVPLRLLSTASTATQGSVSASGSASASASPAPATAHVRVWSQGAAADAGVNGVVFTVSAPSAAAVGKATAVVDYSAFADAGGAEFGSRLRLVELPDCVLTTPQLPACQVQTPLPGSRNDAVGHRLSADVVLESAVPSAGGRLTRTAESDTVASVSGATVLAATAGSSGTNGDFTATSLAPSGSWSAGDASGDFSWSYPITVPPVAAGSAPSVALSYRSSSVDGRTATTNNQTSWLGEGWDYSPGYIERTYETCSTFTDLPKASQTGDNCWAGQILTMNLNGKSNALVWDPSSDQVKLQHDDGSRVERLVKANNGALNGEYWRVTTTDGTQYYFGRGGGPGQTSQQAGTGSTWTEPVYGAHATDPCYSSAGFASSVCTQAWRWNLDYVEDTHGNAAMYYYTPETGYYGPNNSTTSVQYTRGGYLSKIDYGLRDENGTVYGPATPDQVLFTTSERCIAGTPSGNTCSDSQFTTANASYWPDVPVDLNCTLSTTCNVHAPTFWSRRMLTNITTRYWNGTAYAAVDSYDIGYQFPGGGDPALWLASITRTGLATGTPIAMPAITTHGQLLANRVPNYNSLPAMFHWRVTNLDLDTGEIVNIGYTTNCSSTTIPSDASTNTTQCMPQYWVPPGYSAPTFDWFDKYSVSRVSEEDPSALTPMKVTTYAYGKTAAWHFDDNEVVKPANRTYGQFRGYGEVDVQTGNPDNGEAPTLSSTLYYRGMNGDTLPGGKTRSVSVTDSLGETTTDDDRFADTPYETQVFNGVGGAEVSASLTGYTVVATTATRPRTGLPALTADVVRSAKTRSLTDLAAGGVRTTATVSGYDSLGRLTSHDDTGDGVPELCTTTAYADNTDAWIRTKVAETIESQQACPPAGTAQTHVLADSRTYYDGSGTLGQLSGPGNATRADVLNDTNGGPAAFFTTSTSTYDASGRILTASDALNRTTTTAYTPADGGPLTQTAVSNPLHQTTTTVKAPDRGSELSVTGVDGHVTSATYDALGRLTQLWQPGRPQGQYTPNQTFSYLLQTDGPEVVTTNTLVDYGSGTNYVTATKLSDSLGRVVQTQTAAENGGSEVTDTFYDGHGWTVATNNHYLIPASPSTTDQQTATNANNSTNAVDDRTVNTFDGAGRVTLATSSKNGNVTKTARTVYGGDRTTVIPPAGGITTTTVTDARGHTTELDQYTAAPTITGSAVSGGTFQPTTYAYDPLGRQVQVVSAGSTWKYTLDMLGRKLSQTDPDSGASTTVYDLAGQVSSTTDARNQTLAYTYDALGRKTAEYSGSTTGTELASWLWDTLQAGRQTNETRYTSGGNYVTGTTGYDSAGNPTSQLTVIPAAETGLNKSYLTRYTYSTTGQQLTTTPAPVSGMPAETVTTSYDPLGNPVGVAGASVVATQKLNGYALPGQITYGSATDNAWLSSTYDVQTLQPTDQNLSAQTATAQADDTAYTYDPSGQITQIKDTQGPAGTAPVDDQCFTYDTLDRLTAAWTATDNCAAAPNNATGGNIGGPNAYWTSWSFTPAGQRATQTRHALPGGGTDATTTYCYAGGGAHSLTATTTTGTCPASPGYTYDQTGDTTSRPDVSGTGSQTLSWNTENRLVTDSAAGGATNWVYDADGNQLVRRDPASTTIYLPGQEVTRTSAGVTTAIRYYSLGSRLIGESNGQTAGTEYVFGDQHATGQISMNTTTLTSLTRRAFDPYGNPRGTTAGGAWPDNHGFLGRSVSAASGLTDIGARKYDPVTGQFVSVDPVLEAKDPQQLNGYSYAGANPVSHSDPTGLMDEMLDGGGGPDPSSGGDTGSSGSSSGSGGGTSSGGSSGSATNATPPPPAPCSSSNPWCSTYKGSPEPVTFSVTWSKADNGFVAYVNMAGDICNCKNDTDPSADWNSMTTVKGQRVNGLGVLTPQNPSFVFVDYGSSASAVVPIPSNYGKFSVPAPIVSAGVTRTNSVSAETSLSFAKWGGNFGGKLSETSSTATTGSISGALGVPIQVPDAPVYQWAYWAPVYKATISAASHNPFWGYQTVSPQLQLQVIQWVPVYTTTDPTDVIDLANYPTK